MTHLKVEQNTGTIEQVDKSVIAELYELLAYNVLDSSSNLQGRIHTSATYQEYIDYIRAKYPDLYITSDNIYIKFADEAVENVLKNSIGDGIGVTIAQAQATTNAQISDLFNGNTNITQFDEFRFFTSVTNMPVFNGCTNLQHIQIPASLREIYANQLNNCTSLTSIGDTSNVQRFNPNQSYFFRALKLDQTKLQSLTGIFSSQSCPLFDSDEVVTISAPGLTDLRFDYFGGKELIITSPITTITGTHCPNLTRVVLPETCKKLEGQGFMACTNLTSVNTEHIQYFVQSTFINTKVKTIDLSSCIVLGLQIFQGCYDLTITLPQNNFEVHNNMTHSSSFGNSTFRSITNPEVVENYDYVSKDLPQFGQYASSIDVLNFAKATQVHWGAEKDCYGLHTKYSDKYVKQLYAPKLTATKGYIFGSQTQSFMSEAGKFTVGLLYLRDITSLNTEAFKGIVCDALVINNTTPPTAPTQYFSDYQEWTMHVYGANIDCWGNFEDGNGSTPFSYTSGQSMAKTNYPQGKICAYPSITAIYVPDSAVNTYKTTTGWTPVADKIHPISDLTKYATRAAWEAAGKPDTALIEEYM